MARQLLKLVLVSCFPAVVIIVMFGCKSVNWPVLSPTQNSVPIDSGQLRMATGEEARTAGGAGLPEEMEDEATAKANVQQALERFYAAFNSVFDGDTGPMSKVWSRSPDITYVDTFGTMHVGWPAIRETLERQAKEKAGARISAGDFEISLKDRLAYTWCTEQWESKNAEPEKLHANNVFRREKGGWKLIHHHNDQGLAVKKAAGQGAGKEENLK
jgi:ketosteroid isomerase-like protein